MRITLRFRAARPMKAASCRPWQSDDKSRVVSPRCCRRHHAGSRSSRAADFVHQSRICTCTSLALAALIHHQMRRPSSKFQKAEPSLTCMTQPKRVCCPLTEEVRHPRHYCHWADGSALCLATTCKNGKSPHAECRCHQTMKFGERSRCNTNR
jgi:hypothetical protein